MNSYIIRPIGQPADVAAIVSYPWGGEYQPRAAACLNWSKDGFAIEMIAWEHPVSCAERRIGGEVCVDSCMEFFFQPCPETDPRYINCEVNAGGVVHLAVGEGRMHRDIQLALPQGVAPEVVINDGEKWSVKYELPAEWILHWFPDFKFESGMKMRGNFYKCEESIHPHFGCWNPVTSPEPDFHRPDNFGTLIFQ